MKIAIVVGHNSRQPGARAGAPLNINEYYFNKAVADKMVELLAGSRQAGLELKRFERVYRGSYSREIDEVYGKVDDWGARATMELHFNWDGSSRTKYCLMLHSGSEKATDFAQITLKHAAAALGVSGEDDMKERALQPGQNGYRSVMASQRAYSILTEPFFGTHPQSCEKVDALGVEGVAQFYLDACIEFAQHLGEIAVIPKNGTKDDFLVKVDLIGKNLTKHEFFDRNQDALLKIIAAVNDRLHEESRSELVLPLTSEDVVCVMNAEMGLKDGKVDPEHTHSLGERGLLPLPSNITYWNGEDSPPNTQLVSLERNVKEFLLYLGNLKNSDTGSTFAGGSLYRDLFFVDNIELRPISQMFVLAASVHGWFYSGLYPDDIPYTQIVRAVAVTESHPDNVIPLLRNAGYRKAQSESGRRILSNRITNLIDGIDLHDEFFESNRFLPPVPPHEKE